MKKKIAIVLALSLMACSFAACGKATESTVEPATEAVVETTEETTEAETETELTYIEDASIIGTYVCDRATLDVTSNDAKTFLITIIWGSSATESAEWDAVGHLDQDHVLHYEACRMQHVTYSADGSQSDTEVIYSDGDGTLVFTDKGVEWHDNKEDAGKGMLFVRTEPEEETEEDTTEAATETATEAATEKATEKATEAAAKATEAKAPVFEGSYSEKHAGRGIITITNNGSGNYSVKVHWAGSATEASDWTFDATLSEDGLLNYQNAARVYTVYDEDGNPTTDDEGNETPYTVYSDGTGTLRLTDDGLIWADDKEHVADGEIFVKD